MKLPNLRQALSFLFFLALSLPLAAQDMTLDLVTSGPRTVGDVTLAYTWYDKGANIYANGSTDFNLTITSTRKIVRIEFEGTDIGGGALKVREGSGNFNFQFAGTSVWEGVSDKIVFEAASAATDYYISTLRIWFEGSTTLCEKPVITFTEDGKLLISSATEGATCHYTVTPNAPVLNGKTKDDLSIHTFTIEAYAEAEGKAKSEISTLVVTLEELIKTVITNEE